MNSYELLAAEHEAKRLRNNIGAWMTREVNLGEDWGDAIDEAEAQLAKLEAAMRPQAC